MRSYVIAGAATFALTGMCLAGANTCWDNDLEPNGFNARATSPPVFPDIRVADDFTNRSTWWITDFHKVNVEDQGWIPGPDHEVTIYADGGGCPGAVLCQHVTQEVNREFQGFQLFDRDVYAYWIFFPEEHLEPGTYWVGSRWPNATGQGTTYWTTSNGGEGAGTFGCFSLDGGNTWQTEGANWDHAFIITGDCEGVCTPCPGDLDEDCDVDFQDLLTLLANWGDCNGGGGGEHDCEPPGECPDFPPCNGGDCLCFLNSDGGGTCISGSTSCNQPLCPNGQDDCPEGSVCAVGTCCGDPVCAPPESLCDTGPQERTPAPAGTPTFGGVNVLK